MSKKRIIETVYEANVDKFTRGTRRASQEIDRFERKTKSSSAAIKTAFKALAAPLTAGGIVISLNAISAAVQRSAVDLDNLGKAARRVGLTTDQLQVLRITAESAGLETQQLDTAFQRFARRIGDGTLDKPFKELNITMRDASGHIKTNFQLFEEYGRKVASLGDENRQLALAMKAVDTEGVKIVELWRMSKREIDDVKDKIKEYGLVFDENMIAKAEAYNAEIGLIRRAHDALDKVTASQMQSWSMEWEKLKLKIDKAKFSLLDYFGVFGTQGKTTEQRAVDLLREQKVLEKQKLVLVRKFIDAETQTEKDAIEERLLFNRKMFNRNVEERKKALKILEGMEGGDVGSSGPTGTGNVPGSKNEESISNKRIKAIKEEGQIIKDATGPASVYYAMQERAAQIYESTRTPMERHVEKMKELKELLKYGLDPEAASRWAKASVDSLGIVADKTEELKESWDDLGFVFESAFENAVISGGNLKDVLKGLGDDIQRLLLRRLVTEKISGAVSGIASNLFGGFKAEGGPVTAGTSYVVGEKGPEVFVPQTSGTIIPSGATTIVQNFSVMPGMEPGPFARSARQGALSAGRLIESGRGIA